jgi:hypothetical protein
MGTQHEAGAFFQQSSFTQNANKKTKLSKEQLFQARTSG